MCTELLQKTAYISNIQTLRQTKRKKQLSSILICIFTKAAKIWNFGTMEGIQGNIFQAFVYILPFICSQNRVFIKNVQVLHFSCQFLLACLCCSYNPKYSQISHHLKEIGKDLDVLTSKYDNIILMGDFNAELADTVISDFCEIYNLIVFSRISNFFEDVFSQYQCGFCKGYNSQHCLLVMVEKWKKQWTVEVSLVYY